MSLLGRIGPREGRATTGKYVTLGGLVIFLLIGGWLFGLLGIGAAGLIGSIIAAVIGAIILLAIIGLIKRA